jgi:DNA-nicking Smr family endonuclease
VKRLPDAEESALFREAVRGVKPLAQNLAAPPRPPPRPRARFARAEQRVVLQESLRVHLDDPPVAAGDELVYRREGVRESVLRKLRRGEYRVQGELDLHGFTVAEAKQALREFIADAVTFDTRCVRVVHGKGLRSGHRGPVIKSAVNSMLRRMNPVAAFVSAREVDGGTGAIYVLLSKTTA